MGEVVAPPRPAPPPTRRLTCRHSPLKTALQLFVHVGRSARRGPGRPLGGAAHAAGWVLHHMTVYGGKTSRS